MELQKIKSLIELLHQSRLTALELSENGESIRLEKNAQTGPVKRPPASLESQETPSLQPWRAEVQPSPQTSSQSVPAAAQPQSHIVKASMQGILHLTPAPGEPAFVKVGDQVQAEQVVCVIEAMKMFNTLETEVAGRVAEILAEPGCEVKVGQPLLRIE